MAINAAFFQNIHDQAAECKTCDDVQRLADNVLPALADLVAGIASQQAILAAGQELLTLSVADLPNVVTFLGKLKAEFIGPQLAAYAKLVSDGTATIAAVSSATSAIQSAASSIPNCSVTV